MDRKLLLVAVVAVAVVLAGCGGAGGGDGAADGGGPQEQAAQAGDGGGGDGDGGGQQSGESQLNYRSSGGSEDAGDSGDTGDQASNAQVDRAIIRTGTVRVEVENFSTARSSVEREARDVGGYVSSSDVTLQRDGEDTWRTGYVVVRVPTSNFSAMIEASEGQGVVLSSSTETEDVTDRLVDLNARLENLRAQRDQLRTFYNRTNTTEALLQVEERLSAVQGEIERLEATKRSLEDRVAYSTIRVEMREPEPDGGSTVQPAFHEQSPAAAFTNSIDALVVVGRTLFIAAVAASPWLLTLAIPVVILGLLVRRFTRLG